VKNFPNTWNDKILHDVFKQYGDIEKIRLGQGTGNSYAFVCFKEPNDAANAKNNLNNQTFEGKTLMINYYEMKEKRQINNEAAIDKADWEKYTAQNKGGLNWNDLTS
jgi:RNA recognition motif-containing protein